MRSIVLGAIVAAGLSLVSAVPTVSAPANVAAIGQAAADIGTVSQVRCWCTWRGDGVAIAGAGAAGEATVRSTLR
jgi:hypothetical protein